MFYYNMKHFITRYVPHAKNRSQPSYSDMLCLYEFIIDDVWDFFLPKYAQFYYKHVMNNVLCTGKTI